MTMKNELTLKHGVFIAAAVLLIAGIAFAGAAAGEPTHITWDAANVTAIASSTTDSYYIVDVPENVIANVLTSHLTVKNNLTLDFNYKPLTVGTCTPAPGFVFPNSFGALFTSVGPVGGKVLTIKNLVIDGGKPITITSTANVCTGGLIGFLTNGNSWGGTGAIGCCIFENVSLKNMTVNATTGTTPYYIGGFIGGANTVVIKVSNSTIEKCNYCGFNQNVGGIIASLNAKCAMVIEDCCVDGTYISSNPGSGNRCGAGGFVATFDGDDCLLINNSVVKNTIICGSTTNSDVGAIIGNGVSISGSFSDKSMCELIGVDSTYSSKIVGCEVNNCIVVSGGRSAGGVIGIVGDSPGVPGSWGTSKFTAIDNKVYSCTIVNNGGSGYVGGFTGKLKSTAVASISNNTISDCCVVASSGNAAGFCPAGA